MFKLLNIHVVIVWGGTGEDNTRDKCGTPGISVVTHRGQPPEGGAVVSSAVAVLLSSAVMQCCHNVCRNRFMVTLITNHDLWWLSSGDFCANFVLWPVFSLLSTKRDKGWHDNNYCRSHLPNIIGFSSI